MSASCAEVRDRFDRYVAEHLDSTERREVREHLRVCRACAEQAAVSDPILLFAALPPEEVSAEEVSQVVSSVRTGVALRRAERRLARSPRHLAAIASAAAAVALTLLLPGRVGRVEKVPESAAAAPVRLAPVLPARERAAEVPQLIPGAAPAAGERFPAEATIYDWNPGASRDEPRVVWIVDRSLDL